MFVFEQEFAHHVLVGVFMCEGVCSHSYRRVVYEELCSSMSTHSEEVSREPDS